MPEVYAILHQQARRALRDQPDGHTLQPTALVNEAYFRLANRPGFGAESRSHFLAVAALVMRAVLVDHARARQGAKRGGDVRALSIGAADGVAAAGDRVDVLSLDEALDRLAARDERKARRGAALLRRPEYRGDGEGPGRAPGDGQARLGHCPRLVAPRAHGRVTVHGYAARGEASSPPRATARYALGVGVGNPPGDGPR